MEARRASGGLTRIEQRSGRDCGTNWNYDFEVRSSWQNRLRAPVWKKYFTTGSSAAGGFVGVIKNLSGWVKNLYRGLTAR
jgi:hypothetical protein